MFIYELNSIVKMIYFYHLALNTMASYVTNAPCTDRVTTTALLAVWIT